MGFKNRGSLTQVLVKLVLDGRKSSRSSASQSVDYDSDDGGDSGGESDGGHGWMKVR